MIKRSRCAHDFKKNVKIKNDHLNEGLIVAVVAIYDTRNVLALKVGVNTKFYRRNV